MPELDLDAIEARHCPGDVYGEATAAGPVRFCESCSHAADDYSHDEPWPCDAAALVTEIRRLQGIEAAARAVAAVDGHWGQTAAQIAEDMDWQGDEAHIPVEVSRPAFVGLLRALLGSLRRRSVVE